MSELVDKMRTLDITECPPPLLAALEALQAKFRDMLTNKVSDLDSAYHGALVASQLMDVDMDVFDQFCEFTRMSRADVIMLLVGISRP